MAALNFPNSPSVNDLHTENGVTFKWNGTIWKRVSSAYTDATNLYVTGISTFVGNAQFDANVSIGGTLTYEDVKNVDSVGVITARTNIFLGDSLKHLGDDNTLISFPANDTITAHTNGSERVRINSSGQLLINTTDGTGAYQLVVTNPTGSDTGMTFRGGASSQQYIRFADGTSGGAHNVGEIEYDHNTNSLAIDVNGSERVRITSAGKVGIGDNNPQSLLSIYDSANANDTPVIRLNAFRPAIRFVDRSSSSTESEIVADGNSLRFRIGEESDNDTALPELMRLKSDGKLGIGTISPDQKLEVYNGAIKIDRRDNADTSNPHLEMRTGASSGSRLMIYGEDHTDDNSNWIYKTNSNEDHIFHTGSTERLRILSGGKIGIGIASPYLDKVTIKSDVSAGTHNWALHLLNGTHASDSRVGLAFQANNNAASNTWDGAGIYAANDGATGKCHTMFGTVLDGSFGETVRITASGTLNIGGSSGQTTHLLHLQSTGDAGIHIRADSDNSGENDNPYLSMSQDGSASSQWKIGLNGDAGQNFTTSLANSAFLHASNSSSQPIQIAHMNNMCVNIAARKNEIALNDYSGNTIAGMEIHHYGNDTGAALKFSGHNNTGTPGVKTFTQLTHRGANAEFEIHHMGSRAMNIGSTRRIRVPGIWGVNGSSMRTVQVESDGNLCAPSSIREAKINIESISDVSWLYDFNPVTFNFRTKTEVNGENIWGDEADDGGLQYGLIADEVEAVNEDLCFYDYGKLSGVHYDRMIAPLIKAVQEQKKEIDALKAEVAALKSS